MDVLTSETCWALNNEIIQQVTSSWSLFIQLSREYLLVVMEKLRFPIIGNFWITRPRTACFGSSSRRFLLALLTATRGRRRWAEDAEYETSKSCVGCHKVPSLHLTFPLNMAAWKTFPRVGLALLDPEDISSMIFRNVQEVWNFSQHRCKNL